MSVNMENPETENDVELCKRCQRNPASEPHTCPYGEEIGGDYESECTCCPECTKQCAYDI